MTNLSAARRTLEQACALGVADFCACGGSRNSPLLVMLGAADGVGVLSFVDERSAAFFALGRARRDQRPVAVVTTSGTAVAELLPAAIEAFYSGVPLVLITADRPARFRGTGAPQTIDQETIFGPYAARDPATWDRRSPLHINVEFDEPLIDAEVEPWRKDDGASLPPLQRPEVDSSIRPRIAFRRPLVLLSGIDPVDHERVREFCLRLQAPVYAEPLSGLREDPALANLRITAGERMLARGGFDVVIRIGTVPTVRFWRDLEETHRELPVVHFSDLPFRGLTRGELYPMAALENADPVPGERRDDFSAADREIAARIAQILDSEPQSELALVRELSREVPAHARIYLGNSLPIREWDLAATREPRGFSHAANRGANGIDGQLSTFFGGCVPGAPNIALLGDLTTLYDLGAPWIVPQLDADFRIVIINNGGGRIFGRIPSLQRVATQTRERLIETTHDLSFEDWSSMWRMSDCVTELRPDARASQRVWQRYDELWV